MPEDRFFHPRLGRSCKVTGLSDFEFRVWVQSELSRDDFGVLPFSAAKLRGDNDALAVRPEAEVASALETLVSVGLVVRFEHQGQRFICDPHWQDFQKIAYPRRTYYPAPPPEIFEKLSPKTRELFRKQHPMFSKKSSATRRDGHRLKAKANGIGQVANGSEGGRAETDDEPPPAHQPATWGTPEALIEKFNAETPDETPAVVTISEERLKKAREYLHRFPDEVFWTETFAQFHRSLFLRGKAAPRNGHKTFKADFDWLLTKSGEDGIESCVKVHDGRYRD